MRVVRSVVWATLTSIVLVGGCSERATPPDAIDASPGVDANAGDAPYDNMCAWVRLETVRKIPNVIVIIDRSGSMNLEFDGGRNRWVALRDALIAEPGGLVATLASDVRFGLVMYSDDPEFGSCPDLSVTPATIDALPAFVSAYMLNSPGGNTPTGDTILETVARIADLAPMREDPTAILLATDGEPGSCADSSDVTAGRALSVEAVTQAFAMGIHTYALSVGTEVGTAHLQDVANAGVGHVTGEPDAPYWVATDISGLDSALWSIVTNVLSCEIELSGGMIDTALACHGTVTLGSDTLECGTDWRPVDSMHIELLGDACERLKHMGEPLTASFPCDVILI